MAYLKPSLAVYTTAYPAVAPYLADWFRSVQAQSDRDFRLWIALDSLTAEAAMEAMGGDPAATWLTTAPGATPAQIRERALIQIGGSCDGVVLVDSDDVLHPTRVAAARESLAFSDLAGCALRLVNEAGEDMGLRLGSPAPGKPDFLLPRHNIFGFSNSAIRTELVQKCLPVPAGAIAMDWLLATKAWLLGANLAFDDVPRMDYRQYDANLTQVRPPFSAGQVARDTDRVMQHFAFVRATLPAGALAARLGELDRVAEDIETFRRVVVGSPRKLESYVAALNKLDLAPLWWSSVAHPELQGMWKH
jgi:hypothetical protein